MSKNCSSCGRITLQYSTFECPKCRKTTLLRCKVCKENENQYRCQECGFTGP
ncbi:MAG TPA: zinc finger domain-containing protein [Candidatus Norongarragalinales archaeon]|nr:zinc finger domain-containing protein [Candidatus Norongarragalinales archaeon]